MVAGGAATTATGGAATTATGGAATTATGGDTTTPFFLGGIKLAADKPDASKHNNTHTAR